MKKLFTEGFTVLDIAEPLASFDIDKGASDVKALMQGRGLDIAGLRHHGLVVGYVRCEELHSGACGDYLREFAPDHVILPGPGNTLGGIVGQVMVREGWRGVRSKDDFLALQAVESPFVLSLGLLD